MSNTTDTPSGATDEPQSNNETRTATLTAQVETLEAENDRLRRALSDATRQRYRRTALGLLAIGLVALGGAALFPALQTVLVALGASGVFAALLTYLITPERFVAASVGERVYATLAGNEAAIIDDLDLRGEHRIVPTADSVVPARLFVSIDTDAPIPDDEKLDAPFVTGEVPGIALEPTGAPLYDVFTDANPATPAAPAELAVAVSDALVEQFELVDGIDTAVENGRATMSVTESVYGAVDRFDHPVASFLATTLAVELNTPVTVTVDADDGRGDWLVTCRWDPDDVAEAS